MALCRVSISARVIPLDKHFTSPSSDPVHNIAGSGLRNVGRASVPHKWVPCGCCSTHETKPLILSRNIDYNFQTYNFQNLEMHSGPAAHGQRMEAAAAMQLLIRVSSYIDTTLCWCLPALPILSSRWLVQVNPINFSDMECRATHHHCLSACPPNTGSNKG